LLVFVYEELITHKLGKPQQKDHFFNRDTSLAPNKCEGKQKKQQPPVTETEVKREKNKSWGWEKMVPLNLEGVEGMSVSDGLRQVLVHGLHYEAHHSTNCTKEI